MMFYDCFWLKVLFLGYLEVQQVSPATFLGIEVERKAIRGQNERLAGTDAHIVDAAGDGGWDEERAGGEAGQEKEVATVHGMCGVWMSGLRI